VRRKPQTLESFGVPYIMPVVEGPSFELFKYIKSLFVCGYFAVMVSGLYA
jgi:hypothetical protein